jgi:hypothetical protein
MPGFRANWLGALASTGNAATSMRRIYRYDNFPDTNWSQVSTYPFHFHDGDQGIVVAAPFAPNLEQGFREFMVFVQRKMA